MEHWEYRQKASLPYEAKLKLAIQRAREFYTLTKGNVYVGVGGLDSICLAFFIKKYVSVNVPSASISVIEDKSIQDVHHSMDNMVYLRPLKTKISILDTYGYPVVSKEVARKINVLQTPGRPNTYPHAIMTGYLGAKGNFNFSRKMKIADKWIKLFAGHYAHNRPDLNCEIAPFKVSPECCYWLKELPSANYQKETGLFPYLGLMASEGGQRMWGLIKNGCNYFGSTITRSCPFMYFSKSDLLHLVQDLDVPVPSIYGDIVTGPNGILSTTGAKRTGCSMCGFGIHLEKRPHRFDQLYRRNAKEWQFWMVTKEWGKVLSYIGVDWNPPFSQDERAI